MNTIAYIVAEPRRALPAIKEALQDLGLTLRKSHASSDSFSAILSGSGLHATLLWAPGAKHGRLLLKGQVSSRQAAMRYLDDSPLPWDEHRSVTVLLKSERSMQEDRQRADQLRKSVREAEEQAEAFREARQREIIYSCMTSDLLPIYGHAQQYFAGEAWEPGASYAELHGPAGLRLVFEKMRRRGQITIQVTQPGDVGLVDRVLRAAPGFGLTVESDSHTPAPDPNAPGPWGLKGV